MLKNIRMKSKNKLYEISMYIQLVKRKEKDNYRKKDQIRT